MRFGIFIQTPEVPPHCNRKNTIYQRENQKQQVMYTPAYKTWISVNGKEQRASISTVTREQQKCMHLCMKFKRIRACSVGRLTGPWAGHEIQVRRPGERHGGKSLINLQTKVNAASGLGALWYSNFPEETLTASKREIGEREDREREKRERREDRVNGWKRGHSTSRCNARYSNRYFCGGGWDVVLDLDGDWFNQPPLWCLYLTNIDSLSSRKEAERYEFAVPGRKMNRDVR